MTARSHTGKTNAVKMPAMYARVNIPHGLQYFFLFKKGAPFQYHCTKEGIFLLQLIKKTYLSTLGNSLEATKAFEKFYMGFADTCTLLKIIDGEKSTLFSCIGN